MGAYPGSVASDPPLTDTAARVRATYRPPTVPPMPRVSLPLAVITSPTLHRLLPSRLAATIGQGVGLLVWLTRPQVREGARATMQAIVGGTGRTGEADRLALRHVLEKHAQRMVFWQPPRTASLDEGSRGRLAAALERGRPLLISTCHLGPYWDVLSAARAIAPPVFSVGGTWMFEPPPSNYAGRRVAFWWRRITALGAARMIERQGAFQTVKALLESGERVALTFDVIGRRETVFLGKSVRLADGTARLAMDTGALVLPMRSRRVGGRVWVDVEDPLDPTDFPGPAELHAELARIHSQLILEKAECLEDPRRAGAWEDGATADAWIAPRDREPAPGP